jgi:site-specific DNA recombinase
MASSAHRSNGTAGHAICQSDAGQPSNRTHRREFLLSGLLICDCCGGGYTILGKDRYGCATRRAKGTCTNGRTILRQRIETRVLSGLRDRLLTPKLVEEFVRSFAEQMAISSGGRVAGGWSTSESLLTLSAGWQACCAR